MCHALTQGSRTIKSFIQYKNATAEKFITKNTVGSVECWDHCDEIKTITQLNQRFPGRYPRYPKFRIIAVKLRFLILKFWFKNHIGVKIYDKH